ncbi:biopolymer transporter ExbD [bacterium]|nr:biopolymer transporter ExbD [bacterium]
MENNSDNDSYLTDINVTPFVDVLLVLLIIFMITAPAMTRSVGVDLPKTKLINENEKNSIKQSDTIVIGLDKKNKILYERKNFSFKLFSTRFAELVKGKNIKKIYIQADKTTSYDNLLRLMVFLKNQGHENIGLVFDQDE